MAAHLDPLQQKSHQLSIINQFSLSLIQINDLEQLYSYVVNEVVSQLGFVDCVIYLADHSKKELEQVAAMGIKNTDGHYYIKQNRIPFSLGNTGYVAMSGQAQLIDDLSKSSRYLPDLTPALSEICVPLIYNNHVVGVIDCEHPDKNYFNDSHLEILTTVASMLSAKINQCQTLIDLNNTVIQLNSAQKIEKGLLKIANLTYEANNMEEFYENLHEIVNSLLEAKNLFIGLYDIKTNELSLPYILEAGIRNLGNKVFSQEQTDNTASAYMLKINTSLLLNEKDFKEHVAKKHFQLIGESPHSWLGVPFEINSQFHGLIVIQSYDTSVNYTHHDQDILTYISRQISLAIDKELTHKALKHKVLHDQLTGLANRSLLIDRLEQGINRLGRQSDFRFHALLYLDFDRFKIINDTLGHQVGDQFLITICETISQNIRQVDTFARLGGDEFAILMEDIENESQVTNLVERIQASLEEPLTVDGHVLKASTSIGISYAMNSNDHAYHVLQCADTAMYEAKSLGRGQVQIFNDSMQKKMVGAAVLETDIQNGMRNNEFELYYQPIFEIKNNKVKGFEALVRWHHPEKGLVLPNNFITAAEDSGQILQLDLHLLKQAAKQISQWQSEYKTHFTITVNVSSRHFSSLDFVSFIKNLYQIYKLKTGSLCIEITESGLIENLALAKEIIEGLQSLGVRLYLDDFGTGYSALGYLHQLPIHVLKIDKSFIDNLQNDNNPLVDAILSLAKSLKLEVVAEGIETQEQLDILKQTSCNYGQGYLKAKPLRALDAAILIGKNI
ncbi:diguanylate cyclase/phosphodiesterase with GAF sensor [Pseudoalteromonas denitrificans DSM 6059]|uniref:Diguanylate cyclase/phosphodiesterase with GAF sensor n=2 Tax=Pseudoalteromonas TaxID=53246 RepID=A0A1I1IPR5_9GAMM|nr:EAL domain-containing protein [Pseudoalteromonas denitrificans]SFC38226.1 diguanylate cyclase/phosphodiesterase with GAF sensor [Pseudoalteromonas denitrificans DSM 6059]